MPRQTKRLFLTSAAVIVLGGAATGAWLTFSGSDPTLTDLARAIRGTHSPRLLEGTPRPQFEPKSNEWRIDGEADTMRVSGHLVYRTPLEWRGDDAESISLVLSDPNSFAPHRPKPCMGFHTDFAFEIESDFGVHLVLVCFGCSELMVVTPNETKVYDQSWDAQWELLRLLRPYRLSRPQDSSEIWREQNPDGSLIHADVDRPHQGEPLHGIPRWIPLPN